MRTRSLTRHCFTLKELIVVVVVLAVLAVLLGPLVPDRDRERYRRTNCAGNLKIIGLSLLMYSGDFGDSLPNGDPDQGGWFPADHPNGTTSFEPLVSLKYLQDGKVWACPSRMEVLTTGASSAYRYIGSGLKDNHADAASVSLAYDVSGNHPKNAWVNVLFIDGHAVGAQPGAQPWAQND